LDGVIRIGLSGELKLEAIGRHRRQLQLRRVQRRHVNDHIGGNAAGIVIVVSGKNDGVIPCVGSAVRREITDFGGG
jgi:hypothetical protein